MGGLGSRGAQVPWIVQSPLWALLQPDPSPSRGSGPVGPAPGPAPQRGPPELPQGTASRQVWTWLASCKHEDM